VPVRINAKYDRFRSNWTLSIQLLATRENRGLSSSLIHFSNSGGPAKVSLMSLLVRCISLPPIQENFGCRVIWHMPPRASPGPQKTGVPFENGAAARAVAMHDPMTRHSPNGLPRSLEGHRKQRVKMQGCDHTSGRLGAVFGALCTWTGRPPRRRNQRGTEKGGRPIMNKIPQAWQEFQNRRDIDSRRAGGGACARVNSFPNPCRNDLKRMITEGYY
jgi:hypothetical protein